MNMKRKRWLLTAAAFLLVAALSITAFAASNQQELLDELSSATSGGAVSLSASIKLTNDATLKTGVQLQPEATTERTLTIGKKTADEGAIFTIQLGAKIADKLAIAFDGGKTVLTDRDNLIATHPEVKVDGKTTTATRNDGDPRYYFDIKGATANKADIEIEAKIPFKNAIQAADSTTTVYLVEESKITRNKEGNITGITGFAGEYDKDTDGNSIGNLIFKDVDLGNKVYQVVVRIGGSKGAYFATGDTLVVYNSNDLKVTPKSPGWESMRAGQVYDAFKVENPAKLPVSVTITGSGISTPEDYVAMTGEGKLTALRPMEKYQITFRFTFAGAGNTVVTPGAESIRITSPVKAPANAGLYTNQFTKVFDIELPTGSNEVGYQLVSVTTDKPDDVVTDIRGNAVYVTTRRNMSENVKFTFKFADAAERAEAGKGKTFTVIETVRISASTYNPTHSITVLAPKLILSTGESIMLSVPGEKISNASSANLSVAFAMGDGRVIAKSPGTATIHVTTHENGAGTIQVMVVGSSAPVFASTTTLAEDESTQIYSSFGGAVTYAYSDNTRVISVSANGRVTAVSPGTATVYVTLSNGTGGSIKFDVTRKPLRVSGTASIPVGSTALLTVPAGESISNVVSSNPGVVSVLGNGAYYGLKSGSATLTVTAASGRVGTFNVTVIGGTTNPDPGTNNRSIRVGETTQLSMPGEAIMAAYSENTKVATVTNAGLVKGVSAGTTVVRVYTLSGGYNAVTITVTGSSSNTSASRTLLVDQALNLKVTGKRIVAATLEDDNGTLAVTNKGRVTALKAGTDTVLLITSDNTVHRVKITVGARTGKINIPSKTKLRMYSRAGGGSTLTYLRRGDKVTILGREGNYFQVRVTVSGKTHTGYVARNRVNKD